MDCYDTIGGKFVFGLQADHPDRRFEKVPYGTPTDVLLGGFWWEVGELVTMTCSPIGEALLIETVALPEELRFTCLVLDGIWVEEAEVKVHSGRISLPHVMPMAADDQLAVSARVVRRVQHRALMCTVIGERIHCRQVAGSRGR